MVKLSIKVAKGGVPIERLAQVWPAHRDSPKFRSVQIEDGRSFILSEQAYTMLKSGHTLNVLIGEHDYDIRKVV